MTILPVTPFDFMTSTFALNCDLGRVRGRDFLKCELGAPVARGQTPRCFEVESSDIYFIRIGLGFPSTNFIEGLSRL